MTRLSVWYSQLAADLAGNTLPAFSFITPNLIDDMHDDTIADGDAWLAGNLPTILTSREYARGTTTVFVTWDEGTGGKTGEDCTANTTDGSCLVATIVVSPSTPAGDTSTRLFNHYAAFGANIRICRDEGHPDHDRSSGTSATWRIPSAGL